MIKRDLVVAVLAMFCLVTALLVMIPSKSAAPGREYDPWCDVIDDGQINIKDLAAVARAFGTTGNPAAKASILFDSGWVNITDKAGQYIPIVHNLNSTDIIVDVTGKTTLDGGVHQKHIGLTEHIIGWARTYGGASLDEGRSVVRSSDGGYAIVGFTYGGPGGEDFLLVKTDACGQIEWSSTYGTTSVEDAYSIIQTTDGGYAIVGHTNSPTLSAGNHDAWLVKTDMQGNMEWNKTYGGSDFDCAFSVIQTSDKGYALAGATYSYAQDGNADAWLVKTDASGNMQWSKSYPKGGMEGSYCVIQTSEGGYALAAHAGGDPSSAYDFWLIKTDANGNISWDKTYGREYRDIPFDVIQAKDGGYVMEGYTSTGYDHERFRDVWLVKTDASGNMQWNRTYGGAGPDDACSIVQTDDGGYALGGNTASFGAGGRDFWLVKVDAYGNMQWNKTYGGGGDDGFEGTSVIQTGDRGYVVVGRTDSFGAGNGDFWLVKTDAESGLAWTDSTANSISLYRGVTDGHWNFVRVRIWKMK